MSFGDCDVLENPYAYKGTDVLKNRVGTRDPDHVLVLIAWIAPAGMTERSQSAARRRKPSP